MGHGEAHAIDCARHAAPRDKIAEAMGCHGERVSDPADLEAALQRCVDSGKPSVVHVDVDPNMHLFAPGLQEFKAMHQEPGA